MDPAIEEAIRKIVRSQTGVQAVLPDEVNVESIRTRVVHGLWHATDSHMTAILALERDDLPASAAALKRPLVEASLRISWAHFCATERQITAISEGESLPSGTQGTSCTG